MENLITKEKNKHYEDLQEIQTRMETLVEVFIEGKEEIAVDMATQVRVLVHDTKKQTSLLKKFNKDQIQFISTLNVNWQGAISFREFKDGISNITYQQEKPFPSGLIGAIHETDLKTKYVPLFNFKQDTSILIRNINFNDWWSEKVAIIDNVGLTRKDIITQTANKGGGAHFDYDGKQQFRKLKNKQISGIWINNVNIDTNNYPLFPIICEIAYEILETIKKIEINNT